MKITMAVELPADNEIQFFDVCKAGASVLMRLADEAIREGDHEPFRNTHHVVVTETDEPEEVGWIKVSK